MHRNTRRGQQALANKLLLMTHTLSIYCTGFFISPCGHKSKQLLQKQSTVLFWETNCSCLHDTDTTKTGRQRRLCEPGIYKELVLEQLWHWVVTDTKSEAEKMCQLAVNDTFYTTSDGALTAQNTPLFLLTCDFAQMWCYVAFDGEKYLNCSLSPGRSEDVDTLFNTKLFLVIFPFRSQWEKQCGNVSALDWEMNCKQCWKPEEEEIKEIKRCLFSEVNPLHTWGYFFF